MVVLGSYIDERRVRLLRSLSKPATTCVHGRSTAVYAYVY